MTISNLRALIEKATPGPWAWDSPANWCGISDRVAPAANMGQVIATVDTSGWGKRRGNTNSALIVAAVNNLPSLLDIAEAVRAVKATRAFTGLDGRKYVEVKADYWDRVKAALDALEKDK